MSKKFLLTSALALIATFQAMPCTNFLVGKKASKDGSVFISYSADSYNLYGELYYWAAKKHKKGEMLKIYEWDTGKFLGEIPQVEQTYSVIGNINEHQLAISETTFGGREELADPKGIMDYGSLIYTTLQRAKNAREAIKVMTELVRDYGYYSSGESFSIADPNEVWIMEMIGKGPNEKGAVWVAIRIPDDAVSAHANQARIQQFPLNDPQNCIYSSDVISFARKQGYFNGANEQFSFAKAYAPLDFGAQRFCEARVWSFFNKINKNIGRQYVTYAQGETQDPMPLYVIPDFKLSVQDVQQYMRDHYEGTPLDLTKDISAGSYACPYRWSPLTWEADGKEYFNERPIATQQTGFTFVAQLRSWLPNEIGGVLWFGLDDADQTVYYPVYCANNQVPKQMQHNGDLLNFSWDSAFWIHNWVSNMTYNRYSDMIKDVRKVQSSLENKFRDDQEKIEKQAVALGSKKKAIKYLTKYTNEVVEDGVNKWKNLGQYLIVKYLDGVVKKEENGKFKQNPYGLADSPIRPGYSKEYYENVAKETGERYQVKK